MTTWTPYAIYSISKLTQRSARLTNFSPSTRPLERSKSRPIGTLSSELEKTDLRVFRQKNVLNLKLRLFMNQAG